MTVATNALSLITDDYLTDFIVRPALRLEQAIIAADPNAPGLEDFKALVRRRAKPGLKGVDK